jgi:hypothetical protein
VALVAARADELDHLEPSDDLRTATVFTDPESTRSPVHSSQTLSLSMSESLCSSSRSPSSRQALERPVDVGFHARRAIQKRIEDQRADLWRVHRLGERATYTWQDAVVRWCAEKADKATAHEDRVKFQWLDAHLRNRQLHTITRDEI